jgi:hypothetical protein
MTYEKLQSLGIEINRGALASGFRENEHRPGSECFTDPDASRRRVKPPPLTEDLSHLNGRPMRVTAFKELLASRGESIDGLAQKSGLASSTVRQLISSPHRYSDGSRARLKPLLTPVEWAMVISFRANTIKTDATAEEIDKVLNYVRSRTALTPGHQNAE